MYYRTCPDCGAHLDPGERCDCRDAKSAAPDAPTPETAEEIESMDIVAKMKGDVKREND